MNIQSDQNYYSESLDVQSSMTYPIPSWMNFPYWISIQVVSWSVEFATVLVTYARMLTRVDPIGYPGVTSAFQKHGRYAAW